MSPLDALLVIIPVAIGIAVGWVAGTWWACLGPLAPFTLAVAFGGDGEVPAWAIGAFVAVLSGAGVVLGVALRKLVRPRRVE